MRVLFLVRALERGGAERQLVELACGMAASGHRIDVAVFYGGGAFEARLRSAGIAVHEMEKRGRWDTVGFLRRTVRLVRSLGPEIVHSYLVVPNLIAALLAPWTGARTVWGVRASEVSFGHYDWFARASFRLAALASRRADLVIANSQAGAAHHRRQGYPAGRIVVIPNGIDVGHFRPDPEGGARLRAEWGCRAGEKLLGCSGRLDPMKDHATFLAAAARVRQAVSGVRWVCVGEGSSRLTAKLRGLAHGLGLDDVLVWAGARIDMPAVYSALDLLVSSSAFGEGFSNTLAEAMACGVPCVATDVGDAALLLGGLGTIVPARDPDALAGAMVAALARPNVDREALRRHIESHFSVERMVASTVGELERLMAGGARSR